MSYKVVPTDSSIILRYVNNLFKVIQREEIRRTKPKLPRKVCVRVHTILIASHENDRN